MFLKTVLPSSEWKLLGTFWKHSVLAVLVFLLFPNLMLKSRFMCHLGVATDSARWQDMQWTMLTKGEKEKGCLGMVKLKKRCYLSAPCCTFPDDSECSCQICQVSFLLNSRRIWDNNNDEIRCGHFGSVLLRPSEKCRFGRLDLVVIHTELVLEIPVFCHWNTHSSYPGGASGHSQTLFMARVQEDVSQLS